MKKILRHWVAAALGAAAAIALTSCTYDPYYSSASYGYSDGYGDGYGYGGGNFSTSLFISTGDSRWGYDPHSYCYYDYHRRSYYDPYLNGYYPVGYRPPVVIGVPHPHGWRPGRGYLPPPRTIRNVTVTNYRHRESAYRNTDYSWAKQVRARPASPARVDGRYPNRSSNDDRNSTRRPPSTRTAPYRDDAPAARPSSGSRQDVRDYRAPSRGRTDSRRETPENRPQKGARLPSTYNTPVAEAMPPRQSNSRQPSLRERSRSDSRPAPPASQDGGANRRENSKPRSEETRELRSLGQG